MEKVSACALVIFWYINSYVMALFVCLPGLGKIALYSPPFTTDMVPKVGGEYTTFVQIFCTLAKRGHTCLHFSLNTPTITVNVLLRL